MPESLFALSLMVVGSTIAMSVVATMAVDVRVCGRGLFTLVERDSAPPAATEVSRRCHRPGGR